MDSTGIKRARKGGHRDTKDAFHAFATEGDPCKISEAIYQLYTCETGVSAGCKAITTIFFDTADFVGSRDETSA